MPRLCAQTKVHRCRGLADSTLVPGKLAAETSQLKPIPFGVPDKLAAETSQVKPVPFGVVYCFLMFISDKDMNRDTQLANTKKGRKQRRMQTGAQGNLSVWGHRQACAG